MNRKLSKKSLKVSLLALAEEDRRDEAQHRERFEKLISAARSQIEGLPSADLFYSCSAKYFFSDALDIARRILRMPKEEFEAAVACLNTDKSRVYDTCPSGVDNRILTDERSRFRPHELQMSYAIATPYHATQWNSWNGAGYGYDAVAIAKATKEYDRLEKARRAKVAEEDRRRAAERWAKIEADMHEGYLCKLKYETEHAEEHQAKLKAIRLAEMPRPLTREPVIFEYDENAPRQQMSAGELKEYARVVIYEMQKLTEVKFERAWNTKDELHAALRDHFRDCGYDEQPSFRWLRLGAYN